MSHLMEVLITSDAENSLWTCCAWDPQTGTALSTWRGGGVAQPRTLGFIGSDFIIAAERGKPLLQVWPINSQQTVQGLRLVIPGRATAVSMSPDGCYCVAGIDEKIYVWQISSGNLLTIITRHYQPITSLKFTADGHWFISAAEDGMVMVWSLAIVVAHPGVELATQTKAGRHDPKYVFSDHSLPVTDIVVSRMGLHGRLATVSSDRSCKIYDLTNGEILLNIVFESPLLSVTFDILELNLFVGASNGKIYKICLKQQPRLREHYVSDADPSIFSGHTKGVTCLSASLDGETLVSGGIDEQVILWHIPSKQQTRTIRHKGAVSNAFFSLNRRGMHLQEFSPSIVLHSLDRTLEKDNNEEVEIEVLTRTRVDFWPDSDISDETQNCLSQDFTEREDKLKDEIKMLKSVNAKLYEFSVNKVIDASTKTALVKSTSSKKRKIKKC